MPITRLQRWERATEIPLLLAAVVFLVAYAVPILSEVSSSTRTALNVVSVLCWLAFASDYVIRAALSAHWWGFVRGHVFDLVVIALPLLRPLRALRLAAIFTVLNRRAAGSLRSRVAFFVGSATALLIFIASLAVYDAERDHPDANITSFGDALWWALTTVTTVGYGDRFPTSGEGRIVAVGLMLAGIALLGVVTASIASWFVEKMGSAARAAEQETQSDIAALAGEVRALRAELAQLRERQSTEN